MRGRFENGLAELARFRRLPEGPERVVMINRRLLSGNPNHRVLLAHHLQTAAAEGHGRVLVLDGGFVWLAFGELGWCKRKDRQSVSGDQSLGTSGDVRGYYLQTEAENSGAAIDAVN